jgi:hypothetical protein
MAESVDAADLKSAGRKAVGVQVPLPLSLRRLAAQSILGIHRRCVPRPLMHGCNALPGPLPRPTERRIRVGGPLPGAQGCLAGSRLRWQIPHHPAEQIGRHFAEVTAAALCQGFQLPQCVRIEVQFKPPREPGGIQPVAIRLAVIGQGGIRIGLHCELNALGSWPAEATQTGCT